MDEEELQEADVLWPWPDTPPPSPEDGGDDSYLPPPALPELYEYDADAAVEFSCEPFSGPPASSLTTTSSAQWSDDWSSSDGFSFLSGGPYPAGSAGLGLDAAEESFLEADVLWPDTPHDDDAAAGFWWRCCRRRVEEAASAAAAAAAACGDREGCSCSRPLVSSPIDIPMAARGAAADADAARRRASPLPAVLARRRR